MSMAVEVALVMVCQTIYYMKFLNSFFSAIAEDGGELPTSYTDEVRCTNSQSSS